MRKNLCLLFSIVVVFSGCKTADTTSVKTDTIYISLTKTDSLYISKVDSAYVHDSVYIRESGDTVYYSKWRTAYKYRTDTIYRYLLTTDTVYQAAVSEVEIKVQPSFIEKAGIAVKGLCLLLIVVAAIYFIIRLINKG